MSRKLFYFEFILSIFVFASLFNQAVHAQPQEQEAVLQAAVIIKPQDQPTQFQSDKIQPGHSVKISALIENKGSERSPSGQIYVRYALAKPLDKDPNSVIFETEKIQLPMIEPGNAVEITFEKTHQLPSLPDFIRHDWGMREYQAVVNVAQQEKVIGSLAITFSAYYYSGIRKEIPARIAVAN